MIINEFFLDGAIESFAVSVHLGGTGVGVIMDQMQTAQLFGEMLHEFRPVVRQDIRKGMRKHPTAVIKELLCRKRRVACRCPRKGKARMDVFKGDEVSPESVHKPLHCIQRHQMSRILGSEVLWLTDDLFTLDGYYFSIMPHFLREYAQSPAVLHDTTYGRDRGETEVLLEAERREENMQLIFPYRQNTMNPHSTQAMNMETSWCSGNVQTHQWRYQCFE